MKYKSIRKRKNIISLDIITECDIIFASEIVKYNLNKKYDSRDIIQYMIHI